jgi:hypothetical protein
VLEHGERDQSSVRRGQAAQRIANLCGYTHLLHSLHSEILCASLISRTWQRCEKRSVATETPRQISRQVRRRNEQPWQHGSINHPDRFPTAPKLEECRGSDVLGVVHVRGHSQRVVKHAKSVEIEDGDEGIRVIAEGGSPVCSLIPHRSHDQYCPHRRKRYTRAN